MSEVFGEAERLSPADEHTAKQAGLLCTCADLERNGWSPCLSAAGGLTLGIGRRRQVGPWRAVSGHEVDEAPLRSCPS